MDIVQNEAELLSAMKKRCEIIEIQGEYAAVVKPLIEKYYKENLQTKRLLISPIAAVGLPLSSSLYKFLHQKESLMGEYMVHKYERDKLVLKRAKKS